MLQLIHPGSRPTVLAGAVLTLTLASDAVLYLLLPLYFESFGLTLVWVGILLSANRFVRLLINPWLVPWFQRYGARTALLQAVVLASLASLSFVWLHSPWILLAARLLWGCAYALMRLGCLHYATQDGGRRMTNLGWYTSLQEVGPLLVLLLAPLLIGWISMQAVLLLAFLFCLLAFIPALMLPAAESERGQSARAQLPWPNAWHRLTFMVCMLFDGLLLVLFAPLLVADGWSIGMALTLASALMVMRRLFNLGLGAVAVRFEWVDDSGAWMMGALLAMLAASGLITVGALLPGAALAIVGHGLFMILAPKQLADAAPSTLARQQTLNAFTFWRDVAAASGALLAGLLLSMNLSLPFYGMATVILAVLCWQVRTSIR